MKKTLIIVVLAVIVLATGFIVLKPTLFTDKQDALVSNAVAYAQKYGFSAEKDNTILLPDEQSKKNIRVYQENLHGEMDAIKKAQNEMRMETGLAKEYDCVSLQRIKKGSLALDDVHYPTADIRIEAYYEKDRYTAPAAAFIKIQKMYDTDDSLEFLPLNISDADLQKVLDDIKDKK